MHKHERQGALVRLVASEVITSQADLVNKLTSLGFSVTQASVSRDLDELGIAKWNGHYVFPKTADPVGEFGKIRFDTAGESLIVGRCSSGLASAITVRIDAAGIAGIVGTIAGDDTIFIAVKECKSQEAVLESLVNMFASPERN